MVPGLEREGDDFLWGAPSGVTGDPGDPEANKALAVREIEEIWNAHSSNLSDELIDELFSDDFVNHDIWWPGSRDAESHRQWLWSIRGGPGIGVTIENMIAEGDKVAYDWMSNEGTVHAVRIYRFADGKIVERWLVWDNLLFAVRRGILSPPPGWVPSSVESRTWGQIKTLFREYTDTP
jgi:predicted ester cyclase